MPVYKDKNGTWYCKFSYRTYEGTRKQKMKRGFSLKREAQQWEKEFIEKMSGSPEMLFQSLVDLYLKEKEKTVKYDTYHLSEVCTNNYILPYFGKMKLSEITDEKIRSWQLQLMEPNETGSVIAPSYRRLLFRMLSSIFNYAIKVCGLPGNPCTRCGNLNEKAPKHIDFWTQDEFRRFLSVIPENNPCYVVFSLLYYCGLRKGELLALTAADFNMGRGTVSINKTLARGKGELVVQSPKTVSSNRTITVPAFLIRAVQDYEDRLYDLDPDDRLFPYCLSTLNNQMKRYTALAGVKQIRVHDLRHSHASLLINMGCSPLEVAHRLGHENPAMTLNIYSHMFESKQNEIADKLDNIHAESIKCVSIEDIRSIKHA